MSSLERQIHALAAVCRRVQEKYFTNDCCVAATRTGIAVLTELGIRKARPVLVRALACNREILAGLKVAPAAYVVTECDVAGPNQLAGHLLIAGKVGSQKFLLDLSAYQMDRPAKGIHLKEGIAVAIDRPIVQSDPRWELCIPLAEGGKLYYGPHPHPARVPWQHSPNWTLPTPGHRATFMAVVGELLAAVRDQGEAITA